jgi:hypothetical protein
MKYFLILIFVCSNSFARYLVEENVSDFTCVQDSTGWKPMRTGYKSLGRAGLTKEMCEKAARNARNGVVCSNTQIGYKPTLYTGHSQMRETLPENENYGFLGISINGAGAFEKCVKAALYSTPRGVCYWNGPTWKIASVPKGVADQPGTTGRTQFGTLDECLTDLNPGWNKPVNKTSSQNH